MKHKLFLLALSSMLFQACGKQNLSQSIEKSISEALYARFTGTAFLKQTSSKSYLLFVNTVKSQDSYDKAIVVFSEAGQTKPEINEEDTYEFFIPVSRKIIVIYNQTKNEIFIAGLTDDDAKQTIAEFKARSSFKSAFKKQDVLGYGLSYMSSLWEMARVKESKYKWAFNTLDYSNSVNTQVRRNLALAAPEEEGEEVSCAKGTCTSGGAGSTSCSITELNGKISCTVSCASGYYSCCVSSTTRCYCCKA